MAGTGLVATHGVSQQGTSDHGRARRVAARLRTMPGALARDPASARHAPEWARSLFFGHDPLTDAVPWLPFKAREWLRGQVGPGTSVFEFGSGGSTVFLAQRAGRVVSVEHDAPWAERVRGALARLGRDTWEHLLREPEPVPPGWPPAAPFRSSRPEHAGHSFAGYVRAIDAYPDHSFDLVLVDGRARLACLERALPKVRPGGHLVLDNAERPEYAPAFEALAGFPRLDLHGLAPYRTYRWQTTAWEITP